MADTHPGFKAVARSIAKKGGYSAESARAILAARSRSASSSAKKANPRLLKVKSRSAKGKR